MFLGTNEEYRDFGKKVFELTVDNYIPENKLFESKYTFKSQNINLSYTDLKYRRFVDRECGEFVKFCEWQYLYEGLTKSLSIDTMV